MNMSVVGRDNDCKVHTEGNSVTNVTLFTLQLILENSSSPARRENLVIFTPMAYDANCQYTCDANVISGNNVYPEH